MRSQATRRGCVAQLTRAVLCKPEGWWLNSHSGLNQLYTASEYELCYTNKPASPWLYLENHFHEFKLCAGQVWLESLFNIFHCHNQIKANLFQTTALQFKASPWKNVCFAAHCMLSWFLFTGYTSATTDEGGSRTFFLCSSSAVPNSFNHQLSPQLTGV